MRLILLSLVLLLALPAAARAQEGSITPAVEALARGYVYEDPSAEAAAEIDAPALDALIRRSDTGPLFVAVLPESAAMGGTVNDVLQALRREAGIAGTYVVVLGRDVRAGSDDGSLEAGEHMTGALRAHPGDIQATLVDYVDRIEGERNPAGFGWWWLLLATPLIFAAVAFPIAIATTVRKGRRRRAADLAEVKLNVRDDLVALGEDIRALEVDVELGPADARSAYADAVRGYERANRAFETATRVSELKPAAEALEEGRFAMTWAREVLAGRTPPERRPPCFFDPRHGPSSRDVMWAPEAGGIPRDVPACEADAQRVERDEAPAAREVLTNGRRVPYWEAGAAYAPFYGGFYPGLLIGSMAVGGWDDPTPSGDAGTWSGGDSGWGGETSVAVAVTSEAEEAISVAAVSKAIVLMLALVLAPAASAMAQDVDAAASALRSDPVYVDPAAELAGEVDAGALRSEIGESAVFIAVLPESAVQGSPGRTLIALREAVGEEGRYALVVGDELRTLPSEPSQDATPDDVQAALTQFVEDAPSGSSGGGGGAIAAFLALLVLVALLVVGSLLLVNRRRARARDGRSTVGEIDVQDDFVRLGDGIRALEIDVTLGEAGRADYDRAVAAYDRANDLQRRGDEAGANRALDEGLAAIAAARERIAGR